MVRKVGKNSPPDSRLNPAKHRPKHPRGGVPRSEIDRRRELVAALWIEGFSVQEITRIVNEKLVPAGAQPWNRMTIDRDVKAMREEWALSDRRAPEHVKAELERMSRNVFKKALQLEKAVQVRTRTEKDGAIVETIRTEMQPAPDLKAANRAVERLAALHGLNITRLDGTVGVSGGITDVIHALLSGGPPPSEPDPADA